MSQDSEVLRSSFDLEFPYTRTYGPVLSKFFTELKDQKVFGIKGSEGQVICPPQEYDPVTAEDLSEFVELTDTGVVCKGEYQGKEVLGMRLNFEKRYITLAPIATLVGLALLSQVSVSESLYT